MKFIFHSVVVYSVVFLGGCDLYSLNSTSDPVLAVVGNSTIQESHVNQVVKGMPKGMQQNLSKEARKKILDSLVDARAIALFSASQMTDVEKASIIAQGELDVDSLYVKAYLKKHQDSVVVSGDMITHYYDENKDDYWVDGKVDYEYVYTKKPDLIGDERHKAINSLLAIKEKTDWHLAAEADFLEYRRSTLPLSMIKAPLDVYVEQMSAGEKSNLIFDQQIYLLKVLYKAEGQFKPLAAVRNEIEKKLAPVVLRDAILKLAEQAKTSVSMSYKNK